MTICCCFVYVRLSYTTVHTRTWTYDYSTTATRREDNWCVRECEYRHRLTRSGAHAKDEWYTSLWCRTRPHSLSNQEHTGKYVRCEPLYLLSLQTNRRRSNSTVTESSKQGYNTHGLETYTCDHLYTWLTEFATLVSLFFWFHISVRFWFEITLVKVVHADETVFSSRGVCFPWGVYSDAGW